MIFSGVGITSFFNFHISKFNGQGYSNEPPKTQQTEPEHAHMRKRKNDSMVHYGASV